MGMYYHICYVRCATSNANNYFYNGITYNIPLDSISPNNLFVFLSFVNVIFPAIISFGNLKLSVKITLRIRKFVHEKKKFMDDSAKTKLIAIRDYK